MSPAKWFTNNLGLKLASVLVAALLWFVVTNVDDPYVRLRFNNVPVTLRNTNLITDAGQVYEVEDGTDVIATVSFFARRAISDQLTRDNIVAVADVSEMGEDGGVMIELSVNKNASDVSNITASNDMVMLNIEERRTRTLPLSATTSGVLSEGFTVGGVTSDQNLIRISGPASKVDLIDAAYADVDVTGFTSDIGTQADIKLYDAKGNQVSDDSITRNISTVRVTVTILQKRDITMNFFTTGEVAEGYRLSGSIVSDPETISVAGRSGVLSDVDSIDIESDVLDVSGRRTDLITTIDVTKFLPAGLTLADPEFDGQVRVTVGVESE